MLRYFQHRSSALAGFAGLAILSLISSGCGSSQSTNAATGNTNAADAAPIVITTARAEARDVPAFIEATGSLVADETSNIAPKVAGKVSNIYVNIGEFVSQGAVIARIDDRDARLELEARRAAVRQAQVAVRQAEARLGLGPRGSFNASSIPEVRVAAATLEQAQAELRQAETNEKRYRALVESGDVAMIQYEQFRLARDTAQTRVNSAREQLEAQANAARQNNEQIRAAEAAVDSARTAVRIAEQGVADTVIRAPFSGFISAREVAVGEFVSTATVIATLLRTNPIKVQMQVAEADVPTVGIGRGVSLQVEAYPNRRFAGVVTAINPAVDLNSRSAVVEASVDNGDNALRSGMFATARVTKEGGSVGVFLPRSAVYSHAPTQSYRAFVIEEGVAKLRVIQLGREEGESIQILSGVNAEEIVATSNLDQLYEGAKVAQ